MRGRDGVRWPGALKHRGFRRLYLALVLSSFGDWLGFLATTAFATQLVDGFGAQSYAVGGVLAFRLLPAVVLGPVAGVLADRFDRRGLMVVSDLLRFGLFLSIPLVGSLLWLLVATLLVEVLSLFWIPAKEASVPNLVRRRPRVGQPGVARGDVRHGSRRRARLRRARTRRRAAVPTCRPRTSGSTSTPRPSCSRRCRSRGSPRSRGGRRARGRRRRRRS